MSLNNEQILNRMVTAYQEHTQEGRTRIEGVEIIVSSLRKAGPGDRLSIMQDFEDKAKELNNA
jgi:hypothetical protein